jgi:hypothetical protein
MADYMRIARKADEEGSSCIASYTTLAELSARVDQLEAAINKLVEDAKRSEVQGGTTPLQARKDQRVTELEYEISSLIG